MEWVELTARTVQEAKEQALDRLGVAEDEAEFEILEEPRPGLFGRLRGQARVRARVKPSQPRGKVERRDTRKPKPKKPASTKSGAASTDDSELAVVGTDTPKKPARAKKASPVADAAPRREPATAPKTGSTKETVVSKIDEQARAEAFLQGLTAAFGYPAEVRSVEGGEDDLEVQVVGDELGSLIGPRGQTLQSIQELTRLVAQPGGSDRHYRLHVDIGGYREKRREALVRFTTQLSEQVVSSGERKILEPMSSADRKVIHDTVAGIDGVASRSEGEDERRHVIIEPA
jgi:spoIIIJ-associated protein